MKLKSISCLQGLRRSSTLALVTAITAFAAGSAFAATYQWNGSTPLTNTSWTDSTNWSVAGVPVSGTHRVNINCGTTSAKKSDAVYDLSTTLAIGGDTIRGLVIGSGTTNGYAKLRITSGTISSVANTALGTNSGNTDYRDVLGNTSGTQAHFELSGGNYTSGAAGFTIGLSGGPTSVFTIDSASSTATISRFYFNSTLATVDLNAGTLAANAFFPGGTAGIINLNGGTLKARVASATFLPDAASMTVNVKSGGAIIDTSGDTSLGVNVTIGEPLLQDPASTGGDLTKNGAGTLTLASPSTVSGDVTVTAGGLAVVPGSTTDSWKPTSFTHSGSNLDFNVGVLNPLNLAAIDTTAGTGAVTFNTPIQVNVTGSQFVVGQIPLIKYDGVTPGKLTGFSNLTLNTATLPPGVLATLANNTTTGLIYLDVTQAATIFTWSAGTGDWDTNPLTLNWNANTTAYSTSNAQLAIFPNITNGGTVNVTDTFSPVQLEINNTSPNDYLFEGTGGISGTGKVIKAGTGVAAFSTTNTYSGGTTVSAGTLTFLNKAALPGTGTVEAAAAATVALGVGSTAEYFSGTNVLSLLAGTLPGVSNTNTYTAGIDTSAGDFDLSAALLTSTRALVKRGANTLTLSGSNSFDKTITVADGTLKAGSADAFTGTGGLALNGTSAFDMNGFDVSIISLAAGSAGSSITNNGTGTGTEVDTLFITGGTTSFLGEVLDGGDRKIAVQCNAVNANNVPNNANNTYSGGLTLQGDASNGTRLTPFNTATNVDENGLVLNGPYGTGPITLGEDPTHRAQIYFNGADRVIANDIVVNTALPTDVGASIRLESLNNTISGAIVANQASLSFGSNWAPFGGAGSATLTGPISTGDNPAAGLSVGSDGLSMVVTLANPNTTPNSYTGNTVIKGGACILKLGNDDQIPNGADTGNVSMTIDFNSGRYGNLDLNGYNETINGLSGNGRIDNIAGTTPSVLTLGDNDITAAFGGGIRNTAALTTPAAKVSLVKIGTGTQTLGSLATTHNGGITLDSATVTIGSTAALAPGMPVTGTGIPDGTTIQAIINATSFTLSQNATVTNATTALTFTNANSYTGTTSIQAGTLALGTTGTIDSSSAVSIAADAVLQTTAKTDYAIPAGKTVTFALNAADAGSSGQINAAGLNIENATVAFSISGPLDDPAYVLATYTSLTGTEFLSVPPVAGYEIDYAYNGGTQIALVQNSTASGYSTWAGTNAGGQTADLDFDNDGVSNGVEFFMGETGSGFTTSPTSFANKKATWTNGGNIPSGDYGTQFWIQTSTNLVNWTDVLSDDLNLENLSGSVSYTLTGSGKEFMRLKVTPN